MTNLQIYAHLWSDVEDLYNSEKSYKFFQRELIIPAGYKSLVMDINETITPDDTYIQKLKNRCLHNLKDILVLNPYKFLDNEGIPFYGLSVWKDGKEDFPKLDWINETVISIDEELQNKILEQTYDFCFNNNSFSSLPEEWWDKEKVFNAIDRDNRLTYFEKTNLKEIILDDSIETQYFDYLGFLQYDYEDFMHYQIPRCLEKLMPQTDDRFNNCVRHMFGL